MAFVFGEADAAGDGLTDGLGLLAGTMDVEGEGLAVVVELELSTGSVAQPATKASEDTVKSRRAVRLIAFKFDEVISVLPHFSKMEKHADNCPDAK